MKELGEKFKTARWWKHALILVAATVLGACNIGNTTPQLQFIPDQQISVSEGLRLTLFAQDPDGDPLTFTVSGLPGEAQVIPKGNVSALLYWNPLITDTGPGGRGYEVTVTCDDGGSITSSFTFTVWVFGQEGVPTFDIPGGYVLNLAKEKDVALKVLVKDDDSTAVKITMLESPAGAKLDSLGAKSRYFYWLPNTEQAKTVVHRVVFSAADELHAPVLHTLTIVLINTDQGSECGTTPPSVLYEHPGDQNMINTTLPFQVQVSDYESAVSQVSLFWSLGTQSGEFNKMALKKSESINSVWTGDLELPSLVFPGQLLHYFFIAVDNDDHLSDECDQQSRFPKKGSLAMGVYHPNIAVSECIDDTSEDDDTMGTAAYTAKGEYYGRRLCGAESDWYEVYPPDEDTLALTLERDASHGPVVLRLYDWNGNIVDEDASGANTLRVEQSDETEFGFFFAQVESLMPTSRISYSVNVGADYGDCTDDDLEPNSTANEASPLGIEVVENLTLCPGDSDFFRIVAPAGKQLRIALAFDNALGDLDLELYDATGQQVLAYSSGYSDSEEVVYNASSPTTLYVRAFGYQGEGNTYTIGVSQTDQSANCEEDTLAPNHDALDAVKLFMGNYGGLKLCPGTDDWFVVEMNGGESLEVKFNATFAFGAKIEIYLDPSGPPVASGEMSNSGFASAEIKNVPQGPIYYRVTGAGQFLEYKLTQQATDPPGPCADDRFEPNNFQNLATKAGTGGISHWLRLCAGDKDLFSISVPPYSTLTAITNRQFGQGYADIVIYDPDGNAIGKQVDFGNGAQVATVVENAGLYIIEVSDTTGQATSLPYDFGVFID